MKGFLDNVYNVAKLRGILVSDQAFQAPFAVDLRTALLVLSGRWLPGRPRTSGRSGSCFDWLPDSRVR